jgi:hypothetical protein
MKPTFFDLEGAVHDLRNMANVTRDYLEETLTHAAHERGKALSPGYDITVIDYPRAEAAMFCVYQLASMVKSLSDDYFKALEAYLKSRE